MRLLLVGSLVLLSSCVAAPKKAYSAADISSIDSIEEVMRVQAQQADPLFSIRSQESFSDAEFEQMVTVAAMIDATSTHLGEKFAGTGSFDDGFADFAKQLNGAAGALKSAAEAKDAAGAGEALKKMKSTCSSCHGVYK